MSGGKNEGLKSDFTDCLLLINQKLASFKAVTKLQKARSLLQNKIFSLVKDMAILPGIAFLPMPTGSGKTLCSMKIALEWALKTGKKRIIYVIPYNSIIDQTVAEFEKLFGSSAFVLRHQSTFSYDDRKDLTEDYRDTIRSSTENWNADMIVTTQAQFFESVYGDKRRRLRKPHNMSDSVLVFDEAHMLPVEYIQPCLEAIAFLTRYFGSQAILLTATMPDYEELIHRFVLANSLTANLVPDDSETRQLFKAFDKCSYENLGVIGDEQLLGRAAEAPSSLIIVNRRRDAQRLYGLSKEKGNVFHLSTLHDIL